MDSAPGTFTLRIEGDLDWEYGLPLRELHELLTTFGQALEAHYREGVRTGKFQQPSEHFPASFLAEFALLEFDPETSTAVLAPPSNSELREEATLALDNLASLLDAFTAHEPLLGAEARALVLARETVCDRYVISLDWRGSRSVTFDEKSLLWLQPLVQRLNEEYAHVNITEPESLRTEIGLLHWASVVAEPELRRELARLGFTVRELDGSRMSDHASIYAEGARAGLANDWWGEWDFEPSERTAIVWSHADDIAHKLPQAFVEQVVEILRQCRESEKQVDLFLVGEW